MSLESFVQTPALSLWPWIQRRRKIKSHQRSKPIVNQSKEQKHIYRGIPQEPPSPDKVDKAEMAFKLYDKDKDGYVTKGEMNKLAKNLTREQIEKVKEKNYFFENCMMDFFRHFPSLILMEMED